MEGHGKGQIGEGAKLEFSRGFLYILFTGRNSEAAVGRGHYIFVRYRVAL